MPTVDQIKQQYPLHYLVWQNDFRELQTSLQQGKHDANKLDPRGRTPLFLAVRLCHLESVQVLLAHKATNANIEHDGWSLVQEAVCTGDPQILTSVLEVRDLQRHVERILHVPQLLEGLRNAPDFYVEMKWEFTSWVPLMSRICPSDTYKVYKRNSNVRIDTTLLGFDNTTWQRGNRSYIFKGEKDTATMIEIDHDAEEVAVEQMKTIESDIHGITPTRETVNFRLQAPVISNNVDMEKISFERNKSGFWGWRSEKVENVNGYECKVYAASNVEFVTKTRTEHLNEDQARLRNSRTPLQHFLNLGPEQEPADLSPGATAAARTPSPVPLESSQATTPTEVDAPSIEEYFDAAVDLQGRDVGRPKKTTTKVQKFKANLWLSEQFPIKLQEQILPILDLMSTLASPHVNKLKDFITMQLPNGFPVKIEIPLFHVLNAVVTFGNVFAMETPVPHVTKIEEEDRLSCLIDDDVFEIPAHYARSGMEYRRQTTFGEDEDDLMQYAIQRSLAESGGGGGGGGGGGTGGEDNDEVDIWEALKAQRPVTPSNYYGPDEDAQMQRALHESLRAANGEVVTTFNGASGLLVQDMDANLELALKLSEIEERRREEELRRENEMLEEALRLSLQEQ